MKLFDKLIEELKQHGDLETNQSEKWVCLKRNKITVSIEFDEKGNHIQKIGVFEDITHVVDQKKIF
jgi:hypothetical protein